MSNIQPNSIIALLNDPSHIKTVLDASLWVSQRLESPIGLLYSSPSSHKKQAVNYSGCLNLDDEDQMLHEFATEEHLANLAHKNEGKDLLKQAQTYCKEHFCKQMTYPLHRQCSVSESIDYVDNDSQMIITANQITCDTKLKDLIRHCECPILVTHKPFTTPTTSLFAFDNKALCHNIVDWLIQSPLVRNMTIHILMVAEDTAENMDAVREAYAKISQSGIKCKKKIINDQDVTKTIISYQKEHELEMLISGAFGQSRLREWLQGSDTEKLLDTHQTPYLLFPKDFV